MEKEVIKVEILRLTVVEDVIRVEMLVPGSFVELSSFVVEEIVRVELLGSYDDVEKPNIDELVILEELVRSSVDVVPGSVAELSSFVVEDIIMEELLRSSVEVVSDSVV